MEAIEVRYLKSLSKQYPTVAAAATEIINLEAILSLPKSTEHFITDVHGEYEQFCHVMRNGSGAIKRKIDDEFGYSLRAEEKKEIAALIYYPVEKLEQIQKTEANLEEWYSVTIHRLISVCKSAATKYTRSKIRKAMSSDFAYIMEELMTSRGNDANQELYYNQIIETVIETKRASELIVAICNLIRRLVVDHLHVVGDIFDRGPYPHLIMDELMNHHSVDIQWGNHDVLWMGAAAGNVACMANVLRIQARYGNLSILEDGYGINLVPLARLALEYYSDDPCTCFKVKYQDGEYDISDALIDEKMHKAISIIQFKLEGQLIQKYPWFEMEDRLFLDKLDLKKKTVLIEGQEYALLDTNFPTINPDAPYELNESEKEVVERLRQAFLNSPKLQQHVRFLYSKGSLYKVFNGNLLYHGCVPLNEDGSFAQIQIFDKTLSGKALYDELEAYARKAYSAADLSEKEKGQDMLWYIWENKNSPVFGKDKMATFERYFVADKSTHKEKKNAYYRLLEQENVVLSILQEFGLDQEDSHIVNGHVPVEAKNGESPIKCGGKLLIIDGGFCKAYQPSTGIAGYTLVYNSYGLVLAAHEPFESRAKAVEEGSDIHSDTILVEHVTHRKKVSDTDIGKQLAADVDDLKKLLYAYRSGEIKEHE